ncbi:MAG: PglZ domain-containing protein [Bacteroidota bacterium]
MQNYKILWADDEIDMLKPHIMFLEKKGYQVKPVNSGYDALDSCEEEYFDVVFLDENMPGMSGLEVLTKIKAKFPNLPVVMITKNEEEEIMEEAIGAKITDYLIKPLNPNQILLSVKKILENKKLVSERATTDYQKEFRNISMTISDDLDYRQWVEVYKKLIRWELEFASTDDTGMAEVLELQKSEANSYFANFIINNYEDWINGSEDSPLLSHQLMLKQVLPKLEKDKPLFLFVIDNLRYDQWKILESTILGMFNLEDEIDYYSILPTTTAYARNAIFSGLLPDEMEKYHPEFWVGEDSDEGKNNYEDKFLEAQLDRYGLNIKWSYNKITHVDKGRSLSNRTPGLLKNNLNVIVYNFVDMLSHARTDMAVIKELAPDESAYRSLTQSWFKHSPLLEMLETISKHKARVIITTDHGTIRVKRPFKIIGDRNTNTNLRYKQGKNLSYEGNDVYIAKDPLRLHLPQLNVSSSYVFALKDEFFAYPNNYNYYVKYYRDTFQHGGVSMEEMIIPLISLNSRNG